MDIRPIDPVVTNIEPTVHNDRERRQKRQPGAKKEKIPAAPVYKPNGEVEEEPPPNIDVLV
jgi:hypothetical protein